MYLGEAIAKGGINAKLYRKEYGGLPICYCYAGHQFVTLENAIADDWEIVPERFTLEDAIKEARRNGSAVTLQRPGERIITIPSYAIASDEWEVC